MPRRALHWPQSNGRPKPPSLAASPPLDSSSALDFPVALDSWDWLMNPVLRPAHFGRKYGKCLLYLHDPCGLPQLVDQLFCSYRTLTTPARESLSARKDKHSARPQGASPAGTVVKILHRTTSAVLLKVPGDSLQQANLSRQRLEGALLAGQQLQRIDFSNSTLINVDFHESSIEAAQFSECVLQKAEFDGADCQRASFANARLVQ